MGKATQKAINGRCPYLPIQSLGGSIGMAPSALGGAIGNEF